MYLTVSSSDPNEGTIFDMTSFKVISIIETSSILIVYSFAMMHVLYHVGKTLDRSAYATIAVFLVSELVSLILYCVNAAGEYLGSIPEDVSQ